LNIYKTDVNISVSYQLPSALADGLNKM
jgi:hypothetical protein